MAESEPVDGISDMTPLFSKEGDEDGELFRDKVRTIFDHFDADKDGYLKFEELAALQKKTAGTRLTEEMFMMACKGLDCQPQKGIHLEALKLTYAADGSDIEKDYFKVFPDRKPKKVKEDPNKVYEIGRDGTVDISS